MNVLILGGTRFIGRHIVDVLQERGHRVALFNRGVTNPTVHADLEHIRGDRNTDLEKLGGRGWDAVIDTSAYTPDTAERSARFFEQRTNRYFFISTISVYDPNQTAGPDEEAPTLQLPPEASRTTYAAEYYGALKALCETAVRSAFGDRAAIVRPGLVAGPHDPTDRFTYWPLRIDAGGRVLAPPSPTARIQYIDVRDLAAFCVHLLETNDGGTYNCVTPGGSRTFGGLFEACARATASEAEYIWTDEAFLSEQNVSPWSDLPLWIPSDDPSYAVTNTNANRAHERGLQVRRLFETVRDTLAWARSEGKRWGELSAGLSPQREAELLQRQLRSF